MRIYIDPVEMVKEVERDLFEMGTTYQSTSVQDKIVKDDPDYETIELIGTGYKLDLSNVRQEQLDEMALYKKDQEYFNWIVAEVNERIDAVGHNPGEAWTHDRKTWGQFLRDGLFSYTYSERWAEQLKYVYAELKRNPNSRQVIMTMYDRHQDMMNWGGRDRVPCSLSYHFLIRNGKLNLIYNQRSCDFVNFFQADVFITINLQMIVASVLGVGLGNFVHNINSLHAFKKDLEGVF